MRAGWVMGSTRQRLHLWAMPRRPLEVWTVGTGGPSEAGVPSPTSSTFPRLLNAARANFLHKKG